MDGMSPAPDTQNTARNNPAKIVRTLAAIAVALAGIFVLSMTIHPAGMDYIEYWSSGKLLVHHADPYSPAGVLALEKSLGFLDKTPLIMLNPPWALFLIAPLGFLGVRAGLFLWTIVAIGCVLAFTWLLNVPPKHRAFALVFAPSLASICSSQSSPFLLLGFVLFLRFHRDRPFLAGASLLLMAIKPHLFLIFWVVLLADCIFRRAWLILVGGILALVAGTAFAMYFDPHIWPQYIAMLRGYKIQQGFLPTASMVFRMLIDVRAFWLLFVPSAFAIAWGLWYYTRHRLEWDWKTHGMLLILVTIFASPYGFFTDEIVLLPSIVLALNFPEKRKYSDWILLAVNTIALVIILADHAALSSRAYLWTPVTWLLWFLYTTRGFRHPDRQASAVLPKPAEIGEIGA